MEKKDTRHSHQTRESVLFNISPTGLADIDPASGQIREVNEALCRISGFDSRDLCTRNLKDLVPENKRASLSSLFPWKQDGSGFNAGPSARILRKDGSSCTVALRLEPYGNPIRGVILSVLDMTDKQRGDLEVQKAREHMEAVHRLKNEFLSHISHELRTPIGGIMGMTEVLEHRLDDEDLRQIVSMIKDSARSLLFIVEDILDLSNIETGRLQLRSMEFDLQQELERTVGLFHDRAKEKRLKLALRLSMDIPRVVFGDPRRLSQVIRNLVENAIEYTDDGEVSVNVRNMGETDGAARLLFTVEDTGPGIPEKDQQFLFTEFGRLKDVYTKRSQEGTGLGLAIAKKLVALMGGEIRYQRKETRKSAFSFTVSMKVGRTIAPGERHSERVSNSLSALPPLRILMAEDNLINRMFLGMMLKDAGHTIVEAENGLIAVSKVREAFETGNPFDLVLMDVQMPEMNGIEATRAIRGIQGPAALIPIIAITAFAMKNDEELFLEAGMDGYVTKPVDFEELADTIMKLTYADMDFMDEE